MRVKLDENLPVQLKRLFTESGHDAATVLDEGMGGATDAEVTRVCTDEERVLVTQDMDFADIRAYPPRGVSGHSCVPADQPIAGRSPGGRRKVD